MIYSGGGKGGLGNKDEVSVVSFNVVARPLQARGDGRVDPAPGGSDGGLHILSGRVDVAAQREEVGGRHLALEGPWHAEGQEQIVPVLGAVHDAVRRIARGLEEADRGDGALILTDMFGGTPTNLTLPFLKRDRIEIGGLPKGRPTLICGHE